MVDAIESRLGENQWLGGQMPSKEDADQYTALNGVMPSAATHPNAFGWYSLVSKFSEDIRGSWTKSAPAQAAPSGVSLKVILLHFYLLLIMTLSN